MKLKVLFIAAVCILSAGFGYGQQPDAVTAPSPPAVAAPPNLPINLGTSKGYLLGPGDQITATVNGEKDYDFIVTIDEDGKIEVPFSDKPIMARCMTERDLRTEVTRRLSKYLRDPQVNIRTDKRSRPQATVYGEVNYPTRFDMLRKATLIELVAFAGGVREEAGGLIQVSRPLPPLCAADNDPDNWKSNSPDPTIVPSRIYSIADIKAGKPDSNPTIYPGDVIYVHKAAPVYLTGEVFSPQGIYLKDTGLTVTQAIAKVGGLKATAKRKAINIRRLRPGTNDQYDIIAANYDLIMKGQQKDILLQPYDIIEVDQAKPGIAKQIMDIATGAARTGVSALSSTIGYRVIPL
jgi:polysaccharide export outer membrane protein